MAGAGIVWFLLCLPLLTDFQLEFWLSMDPVALTSESFVEKCMLLNVFETTCSNGRTLVADVHDDAPGLGQVPFRGAF